VKKLTSSDLAELESALLAARAEHLQRVQREFSGSDGEATRTILNHFADGDSRAASALLNDEELALLRHDLDQLAAIDDALKRIDYGTGGVCIACGADIALDRLRAEPTAKACFDCQRQAEASQADRR
jgi:DnaK suppressor protein